MIINKNNNIIYPEIQQCQLFAENIVILLRLILTSLRTIRFVRIHFEIPTFPAKIHIL